MTSVSSIIRASTGSAGSMTGHPGDSAPAASNESANTADVASGDAVQHRRRTLPSGATTGSCDAGDAGMPAHMLQTTSWISCGQPGAGWPSLVRSARTARPISPSSFAGSFTRTHTPPATAGASETEPEGSGSEAGATAGPFTGGADGAIDADAAADAEGSGPGVSVATGGTTTSFSSSWLRRSSSAPATREPRASRASRAARSTSRSGCRTAAGCMAAARISAPRRSGRVTRGRSPKAMASARKACAERAQAGHEARCASRRPRSPDASG